MINLFDQILNLKFLTNHRTTVLGAAIAALGFYQGNAPLIGFAPLPEAVFYSALGLLIERTAKFSKEHKT